MHFTRLASPAAAVILMAVSQQTPAAEEGRSPPFFMFANSRFADRAQDEAVRAVLRQYLDGRDYLGVELRKRDPELTRRISRDHTFALPASVAAVRKRAEGGEVGLLVYDLEHWSSTPAEEQQGPAGAVNQALAAARSRSGCRFGISPDGTFLGIDLKTRDTSMNRSLLPKIDVSKLDLVGLQAQRLLSDEWAADGGRERYVSFVSALAKDLKQRNPKILVVAQVSFRYTTAERTIEAMRLVRGEVDGFYLAFPATTPNVPCRYCDAEKLRQVLAAIRTPKTE